ncbi:hypothetical protein ACWGR4_01535 [Embleya sp. NPDC055664]
MARAKPRRPEASAEAVQAIIDSVARVDPAVDRHGVAGLIVEMVPYPRWQHKLADQLEERPDLLTGAGAHGSKTVVSFIEALRGRGVAGITAPACPFCDRVIRLPRGRDGLRCCMNCWNKAHTKPCARCGEVRTMDRRTEAGESLCGGCAEVEPSLMEECHSCGRLALPARRDGQVVLCKNCCHPPTATCSSCGQLKPCYQADSDSPRCKHCADKLRAEICSACGRERIVNRRTSNGEPLCQGCGSTGTCSGCQRVLPLRIRTETGGLCPTCFKHDTAARRACDECGAIGPQHRLGLCTACAWPDVIRKLLTGPDGTVRPDIEPVLVTLIATDAAAGLNFVARLRTQNSLAQLATATGPVTHQVLDKLGSATAATRLRVVLVEAGVLPARDEWLISLETSAEARIKRVTDPEHRKILQSFAAWHPLRRLRTIAGRRPLTQDQVHYAVNSLTTAASLLNWLTDRGQTLLTCTQHDIDDWLPNDQFSRSRGFVTWAVQRRHATAIEIRRFDNAPVRDVLPEHDQRWDLARRLLNDDSIPVADRVAGSLVLLYAQRVVHITQLTTKHVAVTDAGVELRLGETPILLPTALGDLLVRLVEDRRGATATAPDDAVWLYPGTRLGRSIARSDLTTRLLELGISPTLGRNTALMEMAAEMPAAVITRMLGISLDRATRWTQDAGNTRPGYAAQLARRGQLHMPLASIPDPPHAARPGDAEQGPERLP